MGDTYYRELEKNQKREERLLNKKSWNLKVKDQIYEKVPEGVRVNLEKAFMKAFEFIFVKGNGIIEKTMDKEMRELDAKLADDLVSDAADRQSVKAMDKQAKKGSLANRTATTVTGFSMGFLGMGLPDIPLFVSTLLRDIYGIAVGYGFDYALEQEKIYILRLLQLALCEDEQRTDKNRRLFKDKMQDYNMEQEIALTAKVLSDALLVEKFVQGIPIIGVVGGIVNFKIYDNVHAFAAVNYKKRYLMRKIEEERRH